MSALSSEDFRLIVKGNVINPICNKSSIGRITSRMGVPFNRPRDSGYQTMFLEQNQGNQSSSNLT